MPEQDVTQTGDMTSQTLQGTANDDILIGGGNTFIGGEGRDIVSYESSFGSLRIDLQFPTINTFAAAGDTYDSIEDLAGSSFDDTISGDAGANRLFGRDGNDRLEGRSGNDYLNGGGNQDTLIGGEGDDVLRGGTSRDTFVFDAGSDVIEDWFLDQIDLDRDLWGGADLTAATIINTYGTVQNGNSVFNFGSGNVLTLQGQTDIAALETYIFDF